MEVHQPPQLINNHNAGDDINGMISPKRTRSSTRRRTPSAKYLMSLSKQQSPILHRQPSDSMDDHNEDQNQFNNGMIPGRSLRNLRSTSPEALNSSKNVIKSENKLVSSTTKNNGGIKLRDTGTIDDIASIPKHVLIVPPKCDQVLWARVPGFPWWPARTAMRAGKLKSRIREKSRGGKGSSRRRTRRSYGLCLQGVNIHIDASEEWKYFVTFFNDVQVAWVSESNLRPYQRDVSAEIWQKIPNKYQSTIAKAMQLADVEVQKKNNAYKEVLKSNLHPLLKKHPLLTVAKKEDNSIFIPPSRANRVNSNGDGENNDNNDDSNAGGEADDDNDDNDDDDEENDDDDESDPDADPDADPGADENDDEFYSENEDATPSAANRQVDSKRKSLRNSNRLQSTPATKRKRSSVASSEDIPVPANVNSAPSKRTSSGRNRASGGNYSTTMSNPNSQPRSGSPATNYQNDSFRKGTKIGVTTTAMAAATAVATTTATKKAHGNTHLIDCAVHDELLRRKDQRIKQLETDLKAAEENIKRLTKEIKIMHPGIIPVDMPPHNIEMYLSQANSSDSGISKDKLENLLETLKRLTPQFSKVAHEAAVERKRATAALNTLHAASKTLPELEIMARDLEGDIINALGELIRSNISFELLRETQAGKPVKSTMKLTAEFSKPIMELTEAVVAKWKQLIDQRKEYLDAHPERE